MSESSTTWMGQQEEDPGGGACSADLSAQARVPRDETAKSLPARPQKPSPQRARQFGNSYTQKEERDAAFRKRTTF